VKRLLLVALLLLAGCSTGDDAVLRGTEFNLVAPDGKLVLRYEGADRKKIGDLAGDSLMEPGKQIKLADYDDKVVLLNVWGAWCGPCRTEAAQMQRLQDDNKNVGFQVLGVNVRDEIRSQPQDFMRDRNLSYPSIYDNGGRTLLALKGYPRNAVPSTIVLDRQHKVAAVYLRTIDATEMQPLVKQLTDEHP
jgi:thiol-disulfide isomerase/thioredoxin